MMNCIMNTPDPIAVHTYVAATSKSSGWRYDITVSQRVGYLAPSNPYTHYPSDLVVTRVPPAEALTGLSGPVAKLSEITFSMWNESVIRTGVPEDGYRVGYDYVYRTDNCVTYSTEFALYATALSLLPF